MWVGDGLGTVKLLTQLRFLVNCTNFERKNTLTYLQSIYLSWLVCLKPYLVTTRIMLTKLNEVQFSELSVHFFFFTLFSSFFLGTKQIHNIHFGGGSAILLIAFYVFIESEIFKKKICFCFFFPNTYAHPTTLTEKIPLHELNE